MRKSVRKLSIKKNPKIFLLFCAKIINKIGPRGINMTNSKKVGVKKMVLSLRLAEKKKNPPQPLLLALIRKRLTFEKAKLRVGFFFDVFGQG